MQKKIAREISLELHIEDYDCIEIVIAIAKESKIFSLLTCVDITKIFILNTDCISTDCIEISAYVYAHARRRIREKLNI